MKILDKRVVVTGAASGIGKALSIAFNEAGAKSLVCVDMNIEGAKETAELVGGIAVKANVAKENEIINVIDKAITIVKNNLFIVLMFLFNTVH